MKGKGTLFPVAVHCLQQGSESVVKIVTLHLGRIAEKEFSHNPINCVLYEIKIQWFTLTVMPNFLLISNETHTYVQC